MAEAKILKYYFREQVVCKHVGYLEGEAEGEGEGKGKEVVAEKMWYKFEGCEGCAKDEEERKKRLEAARKWTGDRKLKARGILRSTKRPETSGVFRRPSRGLRQIRTPAFDLTVVVTQERETAE